VSGQLAATIGGLVDNDIASSNPGSGIAIGSEFTATFPNSNNLVFGNGTDLVDATPGLHTLPTIALVRLGLASPGFRT
jgi:hypothetical protein